MSNYLTNALKYSAPDQPVGVRLQVEGQTAHVRVSDQGRGLSPAEQEHPQTCILNQTAHLATTKNSAVVHYRVPRLSVRKDYSEALALPHRRDNPKLLHHTQGIKFCPRLHDFAALKASDADACDRPRLSRGRNTHEWPLMGATC